MSNNLKAGGTVGSSTRNTLGSAAKYYVCALVAIAATASVAFGQSRRTEHVLKLDDPSHPPAASIEDMAWLAGSWHGEGLGGTVEEVWSRPSAGAMMGMFKHIQEGEPTFYELELIVEEKESLVLKLKHFNADLTGWEDKQEFVSFPLVRMAEDASYFDGLTYRRLENDTLEVYVVIGDGDEVREEGFVFHRADESEKTREVESLSEEKIDKRIDYVEFATADIAASKEFYSAVFGWDFTDWGPEYASFNDGGHGGGFNAAEPVQPGGPLVVIYATDLEAVEASVRQHGGSIVKPIFDFPGGRRFHFADPSGNLLAVWSDAP